VSRDSAAGHKRSGGAVKFKCLTEANLNSNYRVVNVHILPSVTSISNTGSSDRSRRICEYIPSECNLFNAEPTEPHKCQPGEVEPRHPREDESEQKEKQLLIREYCDKS